MNFFDKLGKKATGAYKGAAEKTGKLAKEAKLRMKMAENKAKIKELYEEIGHKVYQKHIASEDLCIKDTLEEDCRKIDELANEVEKCEKEILELGDLKQCKNCKEKININAKFCPKCGKEQEENIEDKKEDVVLEGEVLTENNDTNVEENSTNEDNN